VRHRRSGKVESEALTEDLDWFKGDRSVGTGRILLVPTDTPPAEDTQHKSGKGHEQEQEDDQRPDDDQHRINDDVK
jgi:hypothetical protein